MNENDKILYQQTALSMLRQYGMDVKPAPVHIGQLSQRMGIAVFNAPLESGDVEFLDFSYAPEQMPEGYRKTAGSDVHKIIKVKNDLTEPEKLLLITSMLVMAHVTLNKDDEEAEHRRKKLTRCARFTRQDLPEKLAAFRLTALCVIMSPAALAFYFRSRTRLSAEKLVHTVKELDKFCLYFRISQQDAVDRLSMLQQDEEE